MKNQLFAFLAILAIVFACGGETDNKSVDKPKPKPKAVAVDGKAVYQKT